MMHQREGTLKKQGVYALIISSLLITYTIWLISKWYYQGWFPSYWWYISKIGAFGATILMSWSIILSTRLPIIEHLFGGLDRVYQVHKKVGKYSFFLILLHPIALAFRYFPNTLEAFQFLGFQSWSTLYTIGHNIGVIALLGFFILIALSLWVYLPYHLWKATHNWFGILYFIVIGHVLLVDANIASYPALRIWMYGIFALTTLSYVYIRFLYRFIGPRYTYIVTDLEAVSDIFEVTLTPLSKAMSFIPGQFAYVVFHSDGVTTEPHPYSIACAPNPEGILKFGIKRLGDHTSTLHRVKEGDRVTLYGAYGKFGDKFVLDTKDCVLIGGGIGITPMLGLWDTALHSYEHTAYEPKEKIISFDPHHLKQWKSPVTHLFYVVNYADEASFDNDIKQRSISSQFDGHQPFLQRGHTYELYEASKKGYISADYIEQAIGSKLTDKNFFLCGPKPMTDSLIKQLQAKGVPSNQIVIEDFNLIDSQRGRWYSKYIPKFR